MVFAVVKMRLLPRVYHNKPVKLCHKRLLTAKVDRVNWTVTTDVRGDAETMLKDGRSIKGG